MPDQTATSTMQFLEVTGELLELGCTPPKLRVAFGNIEKCKFGVAFSLLALHAILENINLAQFPQLFFNMGLLTSQVNTLLGSQFL